MCTAITLQSATREHYFGRTMDFSYDIKPGLYVMPRQFQLHNHLNGGIEQNHYGLIGIGQDIGSGVVFVDGVNEHGFAAASLYFDGYADFDLPTVGKNTIASLDVLQYLLGRCKTIEDVYVLMNNMIIVGVTDPVTHRVAPLHWIVTDQSGRSVVIEQTSSGLSLTQNPIGVMTNSPDINWHLTNLRNYMNVLPKQHQQAKWGELELRPFGQGEGTSGLPGGYSPPSRFVRTAFIKSHMVTPETEEEMVATCFHALSSVNIPKGVVLTARGSVDYTLYTAFMNQHTGTYYIRNYNQTGMITARLQDYDLDSKQGYDLGSIM